MENGDKAWVFFKYERLPNLCYWCGRLDHADKNCKLWNDSKGTLSTKLQQFGPHLRAPPYHSAGKEVLFVPRYYERTSSPLSWREKVLEDNGMSGGKNSEATGSTPTRQSHEESLMEPVNGGIHDPAVTPSSSKIIDDSCNMESPQITPSLKESTHITSPITNPIISGQSFPKGSFPFKARGNRGRVIQI